MVADNLSQVAPIFNGTPSLATVSAAVPVVAFCAAHPLSSPRPAIGGFVSDQAMIRDRRVARSRGSGTVVESGHSVRLAVQTHARVSSCILEGWDGKRGPTPVSSFDLVDLVTVNGDCAQVNTSVDQKRIQLRR